MKILCVNRRTYLAEWGEEINVTTVLIEGEMGDYAAYTGIGSDEHVARRGDKISFEEAKIHFPVGLKEELYRK